ncbi:MAG: SHOCT domain-containing protein [Turicibacter sp.]|nr:SHOCT domain-containing protein [Turicibacter sp.]
MPIFKKNPCITCNKPTGKISSYRTGDGNRICIPCCDKMGLPTTTPNTSFINRTSDTDLIARFRNPPSPQEQAEQAALQPFCVICEQQVALYYDTTADIRKLCFNCAEKLGFHYSDRELQVWAKTAAELLDLAKEIEEQLQTELDGGIRTIGGVQAYFRLLGTAFRGNDSENFQTLVDNLSAKEEILVPYSGTYGDPGRELSDTAFALTNRRFIYASHAGIVRILTDGKPSFLKKLQLTEIIDVGFKDDRLFIDTKRGKLTIRMKAPNLAKPISQALHDYLDELHENAPPHENTPQSTPPDPTAELRKFKQLEQDGIITAEEFEAKKRQLLGL